MSEITNYKQKLEIEYNLKIFTDNIEMSCLEQTEQLLQQEAFKKCKIRLMPDCHTGKGAVIGFTADLGDKVISSKVFINYNRVSRYLFFYNTSTKNNIATKSIKTY